MKALRQCPAVRDNFVEDGLSELYVEDNPTLQEILKAHFAETEIEPQWVRLIDFKNGETVTFRWKTEQQKLHDLQISEANEQVTYYKSIN